MSERTDYPTGVPSWVDALVPDPRQTATFYAELFGWELDDRLDSAESGPYYVARLHGAPVAGIGSPPAPDVPSGPHHCRNRRAAWPWSSTWRGCPPVPRRSTFTRLAGVKGQASSPLGTTSIQLAPSTGRRIRGARTRATCRTSRSTRLVMGVSR